MKTLSIIATCFTMFTAHTASALPVGAEAVVCDYQLARYTPSKTNPLVAEEGGEPEVYETGTQAALVLDWGDQFKWIIADKQQVSPKLHMTNGQYMQYDDRDKKWAFMKSRDGKSYFIVRDGYNINLLNCTRS